MARLSSAHGVIACSINTHTPNGLVQFTDLSFSGITSFLAVVNFSIIGVKYMAEILSPFIYKHVDDSNKTIKASDTYTYYKKLTSTRRLVIPEQLSPVNWSYLCGRKSGQAKLVHAKCNLLRTRDGTMQAPRVLMHHVKSITI